MLDTHEPPLGRRARDGGASRGRDSSAFVFKAVWTEMEERIYQMTFIKKSFTFPSPFENSECPAISPSLLISRCVTRRGTLPNSSCGSPWSLHHLFFSSVFYSFLLKSRIGPV